MSAWMHVRLRVRFYPPFYPWASSSLGKSRAVTTGPACTFSHLEHKANGRLICIFDMKFSLSPLTDRMGTGWIGVDRRYVQYRM